MNIIDIIFYLFMFIVFISNVKVIYKAIKLSESNKFLGYFYKKLSKDDNRFILTGSILNIISLISWILFYLKLQDLKILLNSYVLLIIPMIFMLFNIYIRFKIKAKRV